MCFKALFFHHLYWVYFKINQLCFSGSYVHIYHQMNEDNDEILTKNLDADSSQVVWVCNTE